ncbi:hypothetical protein EAS68_01990 [Legionella jordanis]|uniref:pyridoxamine 5'-phosphate oxidase family protein n=1 Tax=Legionella jordanis TaxID=456 RepID=UPI000EFEBBEC|nr:pyridoxamine 5'-phosphate oxidase family protein [Legionella jordanis]RMX21556.1 hypothetical protein EAS68_01990 [Legionella jordanis]
MPLISLNIYWHKKNNWAIHEPACAVLATVTAEGSPHSPVVAIRGIQSEDLIFTQRLSRKNLWDEQLCRVYPLF